MKKLVFTIAVGLVLVSLVGRAQNAAQRRIRVFTNITEMVTLQPSNSDKWVMVQTNNVAGTQGSLLVYCSTCAETTNTVDTFDLLAPFSGQYIQIMGGGSDPLWTNIANELQPTAGTSVLVTNLFSQTTLVAGGSFTLLNSATINLDAGTNCVNPAQLGTIDVIGFSANPAASTLSLEQGTGPGQILVIRNAGDSVLNQFTMQNGALMCDGSGGAIRLNGDWVSTTEGEALLLINTGNWWSEIGRVSVNTNVITGDNVWENISGLIRPVNGNNNKLVSITSGMADNATNVALIVNTTNLWSATGSLLASFGNAGTNRMTFGNHGEIAQGLGVSSWYGALNSYESLISLRDVSKGEDDFNYFVVGVTDNGSNTSYAEFQSGGGETSFSLAINDSDKLLFRPAIASSGSAVAYLFDTSNYLNTSGDLLAAFKNAGTNQLQISRYGGLDISRNTTDAWGPLGPADLLISLNLLSEADYHIKTIDFGVLGSDAYTEAAEIGMNTVMNGAVSTNGLADISVNTYSSDQYAAWQMQSGVGVNTSDNRRFRFVWGADNILSFTPTVTSSGSSVAYLFDTSNTLNTSGDLLAAFRNDGTNGMSVDGLGGMYVGQDVISWWGGTGGGEALVSYRNVATGEPDWNGVVVATEDGGASTSWTLVNTSTDASEIIRVNGTIVMALQPSITSAVAYLFDTSNTLTNGDSFMSIRNAGTELLGFKPAESGNPAAQIVWGPGTTNVLYRSGTALVLTNGSNTASLAVVNGLGTRLDLTFLSNGSQPRLDSSSGFIWFADTSVFEGSIIPDSDNARDIGNTSSSGSWRNIISKGTTYLQGSNDGLGNYTRLAINHGGNAGNVVVNTEAAGTQTVRPIVVQRGGSDRYYTATAAKTLTESSATTVLNVTLTSTNVAGGTIRYTIKGDDNVDYQSRNGIVVWSAVNKGGTVTTGLTQGTEDVAVSAGTLTATWTAVANGNSIDLKCNAVSSLTQTTLEAYWEMDMRSSGTSTITPQ